MNKTKLTDTTSERHQTSGKHSTLSRRQIGDKQKSFLLENYQIQNGDKKLDRRRSREEKSDQLTQGLKGVAEKTEKVL